MINQSKVVIIGGGIYGVSIAYHLAQMGLTDLALLEKNDISSGATAHAAGLVTQFATTQALMQIRKYSIDLYSELGLFNHTGSLRVASSPEQMMELKRSVSRAKGIGMEVETISSSEVIDIFPQISDQELYGGIYIPQDGHLDPYITTTTMARLVREMGATIYTGTLVTGIEISPNNEVKQVVTNRGVIDTKTVIIAAGIWSPRVSAMTGVNIPSTPIDHQHIALKAVPGKEFQQDTPCLRDPDNLVYMREEAGGLVIGGYEPNPKTRWIDGVPWEYDGSPLSADFNRFEILMEGAIRRIPFLDRAEIISLTCHPGAYSPDCNLLIGPSHQVSGLWICAGVSLNGFGGAGGIGRILAEWINEGEPNEDIYAFRSTRFGDYYSSPAYTANRSKECAKYYYRLRFPEDEYVTARPHRTSAIHNQLQDKGAVFGQKFGWERALYFRPGQPWRMAGEDQRTWGWGKPPYFDRIAQEHGATRNRVCLFDLSSFGKINLRGPGALTLLQRVADNDLERPVGSIIYTQFLNTKGGIEADLTITRLDEDHYRIITGSEFIANDLAWLRGHINPSDPPVEIEDVTTKMTCLALWGPMAREVLEKVTDDDVTNSAHPYLHAAKIDIRGRKVLASRVSYAGELGWEIYVTPAWSPQVWNDIIEAGKEFGIEVGGYKALDSLRLEKGYKYFTSDITSQEDPYSAGLGFCVKMDKGDFIGRSALEKINREGIIQRLSTMVLEGDEYLPIYGGEAVSMGSAVISRVRSGGYGFTIKRNIVLTYLPIELTKPGNSLMIDIFGDKHVAHVTSDVLWDPQAERLRA
jgi:4-methylaminobutanoate oxidase (formaldehyde-forming)